MRQLVCKVAFYLHDDLGRGDAFDEGNFSQPENDMAGPVFSRGCCSSKNDVGISVVFVSSSLSLTYTLLTQSYFTANRSRVLAHLSATRRRQ
jgi:hypothetical protein